MSTTTSTQPRRRESRLWKIGRLAAYCAVFGIFGAGLALRSAYGSVKDAALELGSELGQIGDAGSEKPILLNGQPIFVASVTDAIEPRDLLDRVEARCEADPLGIADELPRLPASARKALNERLVARTSAGIVRHDQGDRGMIACFVRPEGAARGAHGARLAELRRLLETGDLGALGDLRVVFAERTSAGRTHVVTAWTDGPFNLYDVLAPAGDAKGSDLPGVPRPKSSVRVLAATIDGVPYSVRVYRAPESAADVVAHYDAEMPGHGWEQVIGGDEQRRRVYARAGHHVLVAAQPGETGTLVTLVGLGGR